MRGKTVFALLTAMVALAVTPAWSNHDNSQPIESWDASQFVQPGKTLSLTEQLTELESIVFTQNFQDDTLVKRVSRLTDKLMPSQQSIMDALPIDGQIGHLWQALQASPKYNAAASQFAQPQAATTSGAPQYAQPQPAPTSGAAQYTQPQPAPTSGAAQYTQPQAATASGANSVNFVQQSMPSQQGQYAQSPPGVYAEQSAVPVQGQFAQPQTSGYAEQSAAPAQSQFSPAPMWQTTPQQTYSDINLNRRIMAFAAQHFGQQVGDGECWSLAAEALQAAGALAPDGYVFGRALAHGEQWWPGDIVQFTRCKFKENLPGNRHIIIQAGEPNHTAIYGGEQNGMAMVAQQNNNGKKTVSVMYLDFNSLVSGHYTVFRPLMLSSAQSGQNQGQGMRQ